MAKKKLAVLLQSEPVSRLLIAADRAKASGDVRLAGKMEMAAELMAEFENTVPDSAVRLKK